MKTRARIELFGTIRVLMHDHEIVRFRTHKAAHLLAYLALYPHESHAREKLIELFWPSLDPDAGRDNLSTTLSSLRRQLEPAGTSRGSMLQASRLWVRLNPDNSTSDVAEFETALQEAEQTEVPVCRLELLERCTSLYHSELAPGCYEEWAIGEQLRLSGRFAYALQHLLKLLIAENDLEAALRISDRLLASDPYNDEGCQAQMVALSALGRPSAALRTFHTFTTNLRENLGLAPARSLVSLADRIRLDPSGDKPLETSSSANNAPTLKSTVRTSRRDNNSGSSSTPVLPLYISRMFGRAREIGRLTSILHPDPAAETTSQSTLESTGNPLLVGADPRPVRLVTLTGPGGVGKTRMAVAAAEELAEQFYRKLFFVTLSEVYHPRLIPTAIAHALKLTPAPDVDPLDAISTALAEEPALLILDNFEHLLSVDPCDAKSESSKSDAVMLVRLLLERCSGLRILTTSRRRLGLYGEQEFPVSPLQMPEVVDVPQKLITYPSIALYVDRAQAILPDFAISERNAAAIVALCSRLEGIPLAIEMAAGWTRVLTPSKILEQLERQWDFLVGRHHDLPARHQSLRAVADWSCQLLSPEVRTFYANLSVFRGGWDKDSAQFVCEGGSSTLEYLNQLEEHSLILCDERGGETRYRLLEFLRGYGWDQLSSAKREELASRHATYFQEFAELAATYYPGNKARNWLDRMEQDHDNLRAAIRWSLETSQVSSGIRIALALTFFWKSRGHFYDAETFLQRAVQVRELAPPMLQAKLVHAAALVQKEAAAVREQLEEALVLFRTLNYPQGEALVCVSLAGITAEMGNCVEAQQLCLAALAIYENLNLERETAWTVASLAEMYRRAGDFLEARRCLERGLALSKMLGDTGSIAKLQVALGAIAIQQGEYQSAISVLQEGYAAFLDRGEKWNTADALFNLGLACNGLGRIAEGRSNLEVALEIFLELEDELMCGKVKSELH